ncbi:amidohydrolase [Nocardioides guangzhouensis]|uniref:Amidohydrolase n=1 Tax=Nocardioides guangzhouensis TaxID=2497878 RepID=A0A4Q4Z5B0_9ACTN|nr:amidohydrolase [Nocardioides guangzhouensis]RYP82166.1 amidohydrolase [Nocardioides guangzhouensis]
MTLVFRNGSVFDGGRHRPGQAVVVAGDRVAAVLPEADLVGSGLDLRDAREIDLAGGLVAPGFVDAHVHPVQGGLERIRCDLSEVHTREDYLRVVGEYAAAHPELPWITGGGWAMAAFPGGTPTAADLDAVVPDRPVFLPNRDHHGAWVNSRAMEIAGIGPDSPDPAHGRFERDADGRPNGTLHEGAMAVVSRHCPPTAEDEYYRGLLEGQRYLHSLGVTAWQDAILGAYAGADDASGVYLRAVEAGELTGTVVGALWWDRERGEEQVAELVERRRRYTRGRLRATSVKIMQDGVAENGTAAMSTPYLDPCGHPTHNAGHSFVDPGLLRSAVARLDAEGFQVHVHAIGDRAVREALDAFDGLDRARDLRHHIAHLQLVHPDDVGRFASLGVTANMQALWACLDEQMVELTLPVLGEERARWQYPFGDLARAGASLACGSDWPVSTPDPLAAIHVAVNRTEHGATGPVGTEPFLPEQALTLEQAFAAYTAGSSWVNHRDDAGVLREGAVADLAVLDRDPFTGPAGEIGAARVVSTWVDGIAVHEA